MKEHVIEFKCESLPKTIAVLNHFKAKGFTGSNFFARHSTEEVAAYFLKDYPYLQIDFHCKYIGGNTSTRYTPVSFNDIFEYDYVPFVPVRVVLNDNYVAEVQQNGNVKVGCQMFSKSSILDLAKAVNSVK